MVDESALLDDTIRQVAEILRAADRVLFVTGAGISADSALPTYRGVGGLYDGVETEDGVAIEDALSGAMFAKRPALTWKYMWQIGAACLGAAPNAAHQIIASLEAEKEDVWVVTQNVDGLHRAAGSQNLIEVHGQMFELTCTGCGRDYRAEELLEGFQAQCELPPSCPHCNGIVRPNVVLFGEFLPAAVVQALDRLSTKEFDVVFSIGTTAVFPYISELIATARRRGKPTVEINPARTMISGDVRYRIPLGAAEAMKRVYSGAG